jgi:hypothetical protein
MPRSAAGHTSAGAQAFALFFVRTIDWGFAAMSGTYMRHYAAQSCLDCATFADGMDRDRRIGRRYIGGRITPRSARLAAWNSKIDAITAVVRFDMLSFEAITRAGRPVAADRSHVGERFEVSLTWRHGAWQVVRLRVAR